MPLTTTELTRLALSHLWMANETQSGIDLSEAVNRLRELADRIDHTHELPVIDLIGPHETITDVSGPCERMRLAV